MPASIRVLHVEDDPEFSSVTADFLQRESERIEVETETDPTEGLERALTSEVDCVVSDYDMPEMDGIELLERVREADAELPFILFTGKGSEEVASEALSKDATDYLQKEVGIDQYTILANRIENAVVQRRSVAELERQDEVLETAQSIADFGVCEFDLETGESWFSTGMYREFNVPGPDEAASNGEVGVDDVVGFYHPADRDRIDEAFQRTVEAGEAFDLEARLDANGDGPRWVRVRGEPEVENDEVRRVRATVQDVTGRKARERELRRTEQRFQAVFEDPEMLVGLLDVDGTLRDANETAMDYVEVHLADVIGEPFWETPWWSADDRGDVREWVERAADGEYLTFEAEHVRPDGEHHTVNGSFRPVTDGDGTVVSLIVSARDVTSREENREERAFYEALVQETTDVITVLDDQGTVQYHSPAIESVLGYERDELVGGQVNARLHPDDREAVFEWFDRVVSEPDSSVETIEHRVRHADGSWRWLEATARNRTDGPIDGQVVTSRDVTERKERERELEAYEQLIEGIDESIYATDADGEFTRVNPSGARISGYDAAEIIAEGPSLLYDEADVERFQRGIADLVDGTEDVVTVEATLTSKDGEAVPVEVTFTALADADGHFDGTVGLVRDVSEREATERELREYESILRAIPDEVTIVGTDGFITRIIPPTGKETTASGYTREELEGEHVSTVMSDEGLETGIELIEELVTTDRQRAVFEIEILDRDGNRHLREDHLALLEADDGTIQGTVGVLRDIEERKAYERELERQNDRLERFASIASHDLRNPLNLAQGYMEMVARECDSEHSEKVTDALGRMEQLIEDTLTWARQGSTVSDRQPNQLGDLAANCWEAVGSETGTLEIVDDVTVEGDQSRVRQVIENLLRNAVEHGGEDVTVEIGAIEDEGGSDGSATGFYVADDGPGIPEEDREDVFDVGYTTASTGTGFGLAIIGEICEAHGWDIDVTESEAGGARFEITNVGRVDDVR